MISCVASYRSRAALMFFSVVVVIISIPVVHSFVPKNNVPQRRVSGHSFHMAKKLRNKQAELMKKLSEAKKQNQDSKEQEDASKGTKMTDQEIKERNDRRRFDELLKSSSVSMNDISQDGYLSKEQEDAEIDAYRKGVDRLFEGDPAPTQPFENLMNAKSGDALGERSKRVVPWLSASSSSVNDYLIVLCDPRMKSPELREAVQSINNQLPKNILSRTIVINADTPAENRRWCKKFGLMSINASIYSDEKREWMRAYTALGEDRWSMTMFILANERIQKIARDVPSLNVCKTILNAAKAVESERRF